MVNNWLIVYVVCMEMHFHMFTQLPGLCVIMSHLEDSAQL